MGDPAAYGYPDGAQPPQTAKARRRERVVARDGPACCYCQRPLPPEQVTLDHVVPRSAGGGNHGANLVVACRPCNVARSST